MAEASQVFYVPFWKSHPWKASLLKKSLSMLRYNQIAKKCIYSLLQLRYSCRFYLAAKCGPCLIFSQTADLSAQLQWDARHHPRFSWNSLSYPLGHQDGDLCRCLFSPLYFCLTFWAAKIMNAELWEMTVGQRGNTCESVVSLLKQKAPCLCDKSSTLYIWWIHLWLPNPRQSWGLVRLHTSSCTA